VKDMEPIHSPAPHPQRPDLPTAPPLQLPLALFAIFVLECLIALHTLWPNYPAYMSLVGLWIGVAPWIRRVPLTPGVLGWTVPLVLGVVVGEAIGYVIVVPWDLTWLCLPRNRHAVAVTMFLRLFCVLLALSAWAMVRGTAAAGSGARWRRWAADGGGVVFGLLLIFHSRSFRTTRSSDIARTMKWRPNPRRGFNWDRTTRTTDTLRGASIWSSVRARAS